MNGSTMPTFIFQRLSLYNQDNQHDIQYSWYRYWSTHVVIELILTSCPSSRRTFGLIPDTWARASIVAISLKFLFSCDLCLVVCPLRRLWQKEVGGALSLYVRRGGGVPSCAACEKRLGMTRRKMTRFGNHVFHPFYAIRIYSDCLEVRHKPRGRGSQTNEPNFQRGSTTDIEP
jgi:hypothetical protein